MNVADINNIELYKDVENKKDQIKIESAFNDELAGPQPNQNMFSNYKFLMVDKNKKGKQQ